MLCKKPYMQGSLAFGCGQCFSCRLNRRRLWTHRLILEARCHEASCFVTLTYDKENIPTGGTLVPKHTQDWLKRLRDSIQPHRIRYYLVGEYGDQTQRPHYHAALFGLGPSEEKIINDSWKKGMVHIGELTHDSAQYIAGYVTKKMTKKGDPRLQGRFPEFARMSLRPGIGALSVPVITDPLMSKHGANLMLHTGDVPMSLQHGPKKLPLGRYIRKKMREYYGFSETGSQKESLNQHALEMQALLETALQDPQNRSKTFKQILIDINKQKRLSMETRAKIYSKKGYL